MGIDVEKVVGVVRSGGKGMNLNAAVLEVGGGGEAGGDDCGVGEEGDGVRLDIGRVVVEAAGVGECKVLWEVGVVRAGLGYWRKMMSAWWRWPTVMVVAMSDLFLMLQERTWMSEVRVEEGGLVGGMFVVWREEGTVWCSMERVGGRRK